MSARRIHDIASTALLDDDYRLFDLCQLALGRHVVLDGNGHPGGLTQEQAKAELRRLGHVA